MIYDPSTDTSSVRKVRFRDWNQSCCAKPDPEWGYLVDGWKFQIYDLVVDVPPENPGDPPVVEDNRLITSVFVCDSCYRLKTEPNQ